MKRGLVAAVLAALVVCAPAQATRHDRLPLHPGSAGPRVAALQWLLAGHRPNVFNKVKGTYKGKPNGYFGTRTARAVYAYKYRLGYPARYNRKARPVAGSYFFALLLGRKHRTKEMVALAARRLKLVVPGATPMALKIKALAISQLGVTEQPYGSNRGPRISYPVGSRPSYQAATGAYGAPWCASFDQWLLWQAGYGRIASDSAGVYFIEDWARAHGFLNSKAKVGSFVAFLDDGGHIGYVTKVLGSGYVTVEGNSRNSVRQVFHPWNDRLRVFINLPGVA